MTSDAQNNVGANLRRCRRFRGMTLEVLADLSNLNKGFLSRVERGERTLERRRDVAALADALQVSPADLTGTPFPPADPSKGQAHAAVPDVRVAWMTSSLDEALHPPGRSIEQLAADTADLLNRRHRCEYETVGRLLPDLVRDSHAAAATGPDKPQALKTVVLIAHGATLWLKNMGYPDLAYVAADRGYQAAQRLEDPLWLGAAEFARIQALTGLGAQVEAGEFADRTAEQVPRDTNEGLEVYGTLRLSSAYAAVATGQGDPRPAVDEAKEIGERTGDGHAFWIMFGPSNIALWEMNLAVEAGDGGKAVEIADGVDVGKLPTRSRTAAFYTDLGRGLVQERSRDVEAVRAFRQAEQLAPDRVRNNPFVRQAIEDMLRRARASAGGRDLLGLAHRVGVEP